MLREVNIGTSDFVGGHHNEVNRGDEEPQHQPPSLSTVEHHLQLMREELCGERYPQGGYASRVAIPASASGLVQVSILVDLLDQLRYWAIEEATTFCDEPSRLAETEAPEVVIACVCSGRSQLITQALHVMQPMLKHRQTVAEMRRVIAEVWAHREAAGDGYASSPLAAGCDPLLALLVDLMEQHKGVVSLLVEALGVATAAVASAYENVHHLGVAGHDDADARARDRHVTSIIVALHETPLVYQIELAMQRHAEAVQLQVEGVAFFAALVDLPWPCEAATAASGVCGDKDDHGGGGTNGVSVTMADIIAHSDGVLEALRSAFNRYHQHLQLSTAVLHVWYRCAQNKGNRAELLRHGAYIGALQQLREKGPNTLNLWREVAETVGYFTPLLDAFQRRTLALTLCDLLRRRAQLEMLELILALLLSLLMAIQCHSPELDPSKSGGCESAWGGRADGPYSMYAVYPQPPEMRATFPQAVSARSSTKTLQLSAFHWHPNRTVGQGATTQRDTDTWRFLLQRCSLPQLVGGILEYLRTCETVDDSDAADVDRVCDLSEAVLQYFR